MKSVVVGAGAVGLALGSCLVAADSEVEFVARGRDDAGVLGASGLERIGVFGKLRIEPGRFAAAASLTELHSEEIDFVLVCVKTVDSRRVARDLARIWPSLPGTPRIVLCQNGWGNAEIFAAELPSRAIFSARVITGFRRDAPGRVTVTVHAEPIRIGSLYDADVGPLAPLCEAIARGGIPCELSPSIERDLWAKMLYNCPLNPLGALLGVPYGELALRPERRRVMDTAIEEIFHVMARAGLAAHWKSAEEYLPVFYDELLPATRDHESSMLQDLRAGRRTEIDALSGAVVEIGARHRVETPVNSALATLVRAIETRKRS